MLYEFGLKTVVKHLFMSLSLYQLHHLRGKKPFVFMGFH